MIEVKASIEGALATEHQAAVAGLRDRSPGGGDGGGDGQADGGDTGGSDDRCAMAKLKRIPGQHRKYSHIVRGGGDRTGPGERDGAGPIKVRADEVNRLIRQCASTSEILAECELTSGGIDGRDRGANGDVATYDLLTDIQISERGRDDGVPGVWNAQHGLRADVAAKGDGLVVSCGISSQT